MVGFSLAHGSGAVLFFFPLLLLAWVIVLAGMIVRSLIKRRNIWKHVWVMLGLALAVFAVLSLPYSFWQRVFVGRLASGPYGAELMDYAAASGEIGLVKAFISHGVSVNAVDREGKTGTHAAAAGGSVAVLKYLMSQGANLNALDRYGDSPLEIAAASGQNEAVKFLQAQGAKRIRGDDAQREKASRDIVREDIEKMH